MKMIARQKLWLTIVVVTNLVLWVMPSDVIEQIVRDRPTLLGRYSRTHFYWIIGVAMFSVVTLYIDWSTGKEYKRRWFRVMASLMVMAPVLLFVDFMLRTPRPGHYIKDQIAYHRQPNVSVTVEFADRPKAAFTFPNAPPGYPPITCQLTTDARGYRNQTEIGQYDVIALGDSFTEGSSVSDEHPWPVRLAEKTTLSVYNLGMSGYAPLHYLASLKAYGKDLKPKYVVCMIYEGNDFRSAKTDRKRKKPSLSKRAEAYFKQSPLRQAIDGMLTGTLGHVGSSASVKGIEMIDWLPLRIPAEGDGKPYTFAPKQLRDLYESREQFEQDKHWLNPRGQITKIHEVCREIGAQLVVVFAPTKAHVTLPLVADRLPPEKVRAFTGMSVKKALPPAEVLLKNLLLRADARESVVGDYCRRESISFVGLTPHLREAIIANEQVYYTYDQHWTPLGHDVAADAIARSLMQNQVTQIDAPASHD